MDHTPDIMISYSWQDQGVVDRIERSLERHGVAIWRDRRRNRAGDIWIEEAQSAIRNAQLVLLIWSRRSSQSRNVESEIKFARRLKRQIVPVHLGAVPLSGVAKAVKADNVVHLSTQDPPTRGDLQRLAKHIRDQLNRPAPENLPTYRSEAFTGREDYLSKLEDLRDQVLLTGPSGVGKTEIALQFAARFQKRFKGGIFVANCVASDFTSELAYFAESRLHMTVPPELKSFEKARWVWQKWNRPGDVLVIVNDPTDFEELREALPPRGSRFSTILCSQFKEVLGVRSIPVEPLTQADGLKLLRKLVDPKRIENEKSVAREICDWTEGFPLEIDAIGHYLSRNPSQSLRSYRDQLISRGINQPTFQQNPGAIREKTLAIAYGLSWQRLTDRGKDLAWFLGALALAPVTPELLGVLDIADGWEELLSWQFLRPQSDGRYQVYHGRLHEFLRGMKFSRSSELRPLLLRSLRSRAHEILNSRSLENADMLAATQFEYFGYDETSWVAKDDRSLFLRAVAKCHESRGVHIRVEAAARKAMDLAPPLPKVNRTARNVAEIWELKYTSIGAQIGQGKYSTATRGLRGLLAQVPGRRPQLRRRRVWGKLGDVFRLLGRLGDAEDAYKRVLMLSVDDCQRAEARYPLARVERLLGNHEIAGGLYQEAAKGLEAARDFEPRKNHAWSLFGVGEVARLMRNYEAAMKSYETAHREFLQLEFKEGQAYALWGTGEIRRWQRDFAGAFEDHEASEELCLEIGDKRSQVWAIMGMAEVWRAKGEPEKAKKEYERALGVLTEHRPEEDCEPTERALIQLGLAASLRLLGKGRRENYDFPYGVYRRRKMAYYEVQCLVDRALAEPSAGGFRRDLRMAEEICRLKEYHYELQEIREIRERPGNLWIHELNPT